MARAPVMIGAMAGRMQIDPHRKCALKIDPRPLIVEMPVSNLREIA
jgi:hypothetical protein